MLTLRRLAILSLLLGVFTAPAALAQSADLAVTKDGPVQAPAGSNVSYVLTVSNFGGDPAVSVVLTDAIPNGMTFVGIVQGSGTPFVCSTPAGGPISCTAPTMLANTSATFTITFNIPAGTPAGTTFTNVATVSSDTPDPNEENNTAAAATSTPPPPQSDLYVSKLGPSSAPPDSDVSYTITVGNAGPAAGALTLTDKLPDAMTFVSLSQSGPTLSCTTPAVGAGGTINCTSGSFPSGGVTTVTLTGHIPSGTASGTMFENVATVTGGNPDPNAENNSGTTALTVSSVDVSVTKSGPASASAGGDITYTITLANVGSNPTSVTLTDAIPAGTTFGSLTQMNGPAATCSLPAPNTTGTVSCTITLFAASASAQFTLIVHVGNATTVTNTATVSTPDFDVNTSNNSSTVATSITPVTDLAVTKSGPATVTAGNNITYTITVTNNGPSNAVSVAMSDPLPLNTTFVSVTQNSGPTFNCNAPPVGANGTVTCATSLLVSGSTATFTLVARVNPGASGTVVNAASVPQTNDPNTANNSSSTTATVTQSSDLSVTKSGPPSAVAGSNVTYTVTVANAGPSDAPNATLTDALPPNTTFVSETQTSGPLFNCTNPAAGANGTVSCTIASMPAGSSAAFTIVARANPGASGSVTNTATVATTNDPNNANNSSSTTATLTQSADVGVTKTGPSTVVAGSNITYTVTVTNNGPSDAATVTMNDPLPAGTTFVSESQTSGPTFTCTTPAPGASGTVNCTIATMPAASTAVFNIVVATSFNATGPITNTASVTTASDANTANNSSAAATTVSAAPTDVSITKTADAPRYTTGAQATYTIRVTNPGPADAANTVVTDPLPPGSTLRLVTPSQGSCSGTSTITCSLGTLTAGSTATITLVVTLPLTPGDVTNTASVTVGSGDPNPGNNTSAVTVAVVTPEIIPVLSPGMLMLLAAALALTGVLVKK